MELLTTLLELFLGALAANLFAVAVIGGLALLMKVIGWIINRSIFGLVLLKRRLVKEFQAIKPKFAPVRIIQLSDLEKEPLIEK